jgi:hypothetical protein
MLGEDEKPEAINALAIAEFSGESAQSAFDNHVLPTTCREHTDRFIH